MTHFVIVAGLVLLAGCLNPREDNVPIQSEQVVTQRPISDNEARTLTGRFSWNTRYGIEVQIATDRIQSARVVEYSKDGTMLDVPQSGHTADHNISIVFDEHTETAIGIANYKVNILPTVRNDTLFVSVSGRDVKMQEMPNKTN